MLPSKIVLIRHAEKPDERDDPNLSARGRQRAAALGVAIPDNFGRPDQIFATAPSKNSNRPIETVTPLSDSLQIQIRAKWTSDQVSELAEHLRGGKYDNESIVVAWHHETLPQLAAELGVFPLLPPWLDTVFDRYWVITYDGDKVKWADHPQHLLAGDSQE